MLFAPYKFLLVNFIDFFFYQVALKQAWLEKIQPILVLNKIDRLILEMKLSPLDIYVHLSQLLEQVNAVMGELFASQVMDETAVKTTAQDNETKQTSSKCFFSINN